MSGLRAECGRIAAALAGGGDGGDGGGVAGKRHQLWSCSSYSAKRRRDAKETLSSFLYVALNLGVVIT